MRLLEKDTLFAGRYLLVRQVGVGGFSEVWQVRDEDAEGVTVALKVYAPNRGLDDDGIALFRKEYAIALPINHPHLLKVHYFGVYEGSPYLIMPYCASGSVGAHLMQGKIFSEEEAASLLRQIAGALAYLHSRTPSIIHQDIKPDNILIDEDGHYRLSDFGISSRIRHTIAKSTGRNTATLTVAYAPPERFDGSPRCVTTSDVFSLGVMLYELCTGDVPWMGSGGAALLKGAEIPNLPPPYSRRFNELVKSCLHPNPEKRPSATQLVRLATLFEEEGYWNQVNAEAKARVRPGSAPRRRMRPAVITGLFLITALTGGLFYYYRPASEPVNPGTAKTAEAAPEPPDLIAREERLARYRAYLEQGNDFFAKKDYKRALMQYFLAQAFSSSDHASDIGSRIESCEILARQQGTAPAEISSIRTLAIREAEQETRKLAAAPPRPEQRQAPAKSPVTENASPAIALPSGNAAEAERTKTAGQAADWIKKGERLFRENQFEAAFGLFSRAAGVDDAAGHYFTGLLYSSGQGVRRDAGKAREHFEEAVAGGYELANYPLSKLYRGGRGVAADEKLAQGHLMKAIPVVVTLAEKGDVLAQAYYGEILETGLRGAKDEKEAAVWYEKAGEQGYAPAQYAAGKLYNDGRGVGKNYLAANSWFAKAATQGHRDAQYGLGYNQVLNRGQKDLTAGAAWLGKAAEQGHPEAQYYLGILYAYGQGLPRSVRQARHWLLQAKASGFAKAGNVITFLEGGYTQPVKVENPQTGDQMEITVLYNDPFSALGLLSQNRDLTTGVLKFQIRYHLKSPYPFCHVKPEGYGFEYSGGFPALKEKEGITYPTLPAIRKAF